MICEKCGILITNRRLNISQAALFFGVSRRTIYNWMEDNKIEWFIAAGGKKKIIANCLCQKEKKDDSETSNTTNSGK